MAVEISLHSISGWVVVAEVEEAEVEMYSWNFASESAEVAAMVSLRRPSNNDVLSTTMKPSSRQFATFRYVQTVRVAAEVVG